MLNKNPARLGKWRRGKKTCDFVFAIGEADKSDRRGWILDIGASRHLVSDVQHLIESRLCNDEIAMADSVSLQLTKYGSVRLNVIANGAAATVTLTDVYLAPSQAKNIVSYKKRNCKGFALVFDEDKRSLARRSDGAVAFDLAIKSNVLLSGAAEDFAADVQEGTLLHFHQRMARDPASGIRLTSHLRTACVSCMECKQPRNAHPKRDSGETAPIDRTRGEAAAKQFEAFLTHFEERFDCGIHVLRNGGGDVYANVELFCKRTGVARQISEARDKSLNEKAERMRRTILNLARSMMFACALPLNFRGDAVLYAVYVLKRSTTRSNPKRVPLLGMLTGTAPDLR
uniref:Retrovirus-related Pol polyprotein from transposon TNT 1-94-like beta-barrel domain-containing protein n=1 Tax=Peronospora matthiolae TaxID=2874970 RepID=A0AAV1VEB0_9STRA